jgi:hypothetical protein
MSNTRDLTPDERARADAALDKAVELCRKLLGIDPAERKLLLEQEFRTRISSKAMAGYEHDYGAIVAALLNLKSLPGAFMLDTLPEHPEHIAYVYSDDPGCIYLHARFFDQGLVRMARTLVHEAACWDCVRNTDASAGSPAACRELSYTLHRHQVDSFGLAAERVAAQQHVA